MKATILFEKIIGTPCADHKIDGKYILQFDLNISMTLKLIYTTSQRKL